MASVASEVADVFRSHFELSSTSDVEQFAYNQTRGWDSLGHLGLVAKLEEVFGIMMETDDVLAMSDYSKAVEIIERYRAAG